MTDLRKAAEMALERLESHEYWMDERAIQALRQALAQPNDFIYSQNHAFRISPSTGDFGIGSAPAKTLEHKDWCASLTQVLACYPPRPAPCNCKPEYVDAVNMSKERVDETAKREHEPVAWRNAAVRVGEDLCSVGPFGYYDMTAEQWLDWALSVVTVHVPKPKREWVGLTDDDFNVKQVGEFDVVKFAKYIEAKLKERNT